ncbi:UNVERIFIED_CONTAM: hypothetical protein FKN15_024285 [Acipenser sinensis]
MECSDYIQSNGVNIGCNFSSADLEDYTDFNICVNGSSAAGPLIPVYFRFELQNLVKPAVINEINVTKVGNERLHLEWKPPVGKIKSHCLEYEVQCREDESEWTVCDISLRDYRRYKDDNVDRLPGKHRLCSLRCGYVTLLVISTLPVVGIINQTCVNFAKLNNRLVNISGWLVRCIVQFAPLRASNTISSEPGPP